MKTLLFSIAAVTVILILMTSFMVSERSTVVVAENGDELAIPEDVTAILDKSCYGCHNVEAKSDKAKKKLLIDKLGTLSPAKLVGKLGDISDVVKEKDMPPEKFLAKYPDKNLTGKERERLIEWADRTADELLK